MREMSAASGQAVRPSSSEERIAKLRIEAARKRNATKPVLSEQNLIRLARAFRDIEAGGVEFGLRQIEAFLDDADVRWRDWF